MGYANVFATDEAEIAERQTGAESGSQFAWELRVMVVSAFWTLPGILSGILVRLCVPEGGPVEWWLVGGGVLGAIAGGILEADHWTG
jgi:hypothetical protein